MALTATATISTRRKIISSLNMRGCYIVSRNQYKANIYYASGALRTGSSNAYVLRTYAEVNGKNEIIYGGVANG